MPEVSLVMALLADGVPLSLLLDLADPFALDSQEIYRREGCDSSWLEKAA